ncbi:PAS/PAC sensor signal transduction histidine kinase [Sesbania bispinosa]|nr:PAS/PAC sensor signal transduction histidine kinase [Sesbania bispinosa]
MLLPGSGFATIVARLTEAGFGRDIGGDSDHDGGQHCWIMVRRGSCGAQPAKRWWLGVAATSSRRRIEHRGGHD